MIYIIQSANGYVKIGYTNRDVKERLSSIQCCSPLKLEIIKIYDMERGYERVLHRYLAKFKVHGEWFNIPKKELGKIVELSNLEALDYD